MCFVQMQDHHQNPPMSEGALQTTRPTTNNDAARQTQPPASLTPQTTTNAPAPTAVIAESPKFKRPADLQRTPSSPVLLSNPIQRSGSNTSLNHSSSPSLLKKSSASSLRGEMPPGTPRAAASRRSSYAPNLPSPQGPPSPLPLVEEKPLLQAADIAEECFKKEIVLHEEGTGLTGAGTIVIIHDQCYGHRYARPKTSKSTLSTIMERPERMLASVRGVAAAYVRLGERHHDGNNPLRPGQDAPQRVPFQIRKTSRVIDLTSTAVTNVHGMKWMQEFKSLCENAERKLAANGKELTRDAPVVPGQPPKRQFHPLDLYLCPESQDAIQGALGGVVEAIDAVFQQSSISRAFVCIRPPGHHCSADWPSGFCWINNVHVGIEHAMAHYGLTHAAIIDFDLHHGDGSQAIAWERNKKVQAMHKNTPSWKKTSIGYFSLHDINSFPCEDGDDEKVQAASLCIDNAHGQSIWNIHLETWATEEEFWQIYEAKYLVLLEKTRRYLRLHTSRLKNSPNHPAPKAAIFLSAGFDASEHETAGMQRHTVNVPTEFYARFTRDVVRLAEESNTGVDGRIISVLEGGYSDRALTSGVMSHISGLCDGQIRTDMKPEAGLTLDMQRRLNELSLQDNKQITVSPGTDSSIVSYDCQWWHPSQLALLESLLAPAVAPVPKKVRTSPPNHFSSPTQSFSAKVVDPTKLQRSASGRFPPNGLSRGPSPPIPEVDWATAAHTLSKLLIPSDRQTKSYKAEELAETRVKKEKPAVIPSSTHVDPSGRQLRGRKTATTYADRESEDEPIAQRTESKASRRQTIADFALASKEPPELQRTASRRVSIASSVGSVTGDRIASRPSTSIAERRRSVTPAVATSAVQVKKARGSGAVAARAPKAQPAVPRVPSSYLSKTTASKEKEKEKEKENDIDELTSGLQRVTLKLPPKEEYEAREKQKEVEKKAKSAARKPPVPRSTATASKPMATKRANGRPAKVAKSPSTAELEGSRIATTADTTLVQPQATQHKNGSTDVKNAPSSRQVSPGHKTSSQLPLLDSLRAFTANMAPPELRDMHITPEELPRPAFVTPDSPITHRTSPRPDTPPPPPPSAAPGFINYNSNSFTSSGLPSASAVPEFAQRQSSEQAPLQWLPPNSDPSIPGAAVSSSRPLSPATKPQNLPNFSAHGIIPFAPAAGPVTATPDGSRGEVSKLRKEVRDIWEVPDTPQR